MQVKVLVFGDVRGKFALLNKRIAAYNSKAGPFEVVFCVGEFFGEDGPANDALLQGRTPAPVVPVYVLGPCSPSTTAFYPDTSAEIAENITYLGNRGQLNLACGLSVAFLSGVYASTASSHEFNEGTVQELLVPATAASKFAGVDILLTSDWPSDVHRYVSAPPSSPVDGSALISKVATMLRPRYHIAGLHDVYYERQPYRNHRVLQDPAAQCTRFVACAGLGNAAKQKFVYAFNMTPMTQLSKQQVCEQPGDAGEYPYAQAMAALARAADERQMHSEGMGKGEGKNYFFDMNADMTTYEGEGRRGKRGGGNMVYDDELKRRPPRQQQGPCWFCLSSAEVQKHMIVCIGDCTYMALPKGPLALGAHFLVMPVGHIQALTAADKAVRSEMRRFRGALRECFAATADMDVVFFERNYRTQHLQMNCVAVPKQCDVKGVFTKMAIEHNLSLHSADEGGDVWDVIAEGLPYLAVHLPDGSLLYTTQMKGFPMQFARTVLCSKALLDVPDRIDWRSVSMTREEEVDAVNQFRDQFSKWDFTREGDE